jgi:hypothetical protein
MLTRSHAPHVTTDLRIVPGAQYAVHAAHLSAVHTGRLSGPSWSADLCYYEGRLPRRPQSASSNSRHSECRKSLTLVSMRQVE